jgi:transposase
MIPVGVRIFVCTEPIDMRYGFDRLAATARLRVGEDPQQGGALVVFGNRSANRLKILWFDRNGYVLLYKRLHRAFFELPSGPSGSVRIEANALGVLLAGVDRERRRRSKAPSTSARLIDLQSRRVKTLQ